jgi:ATP-dependent Clp protease adaptor protein ClpS
MKEVHMGQIKTDLSKGYQQQEDCLSSLEVPDMFNVIIYNDDYTPMDFVVGVLQDVFSKDYDSAYTIMMNIHSKGWDICGSFPHEIAEMKVLQVENRAKTEGYPLRCLFKKFE